MRLINETTRAYFDFSGPVTPTLVLNENGLYVPFSPNIAALRYLSREYHAIEREYDAMLALHEKIDNGKCSRDDFVEDCHDCMARALHEKSVEKVNGILKEMWQDYWNNSSYRNQLFQPLIIAVLRDISHYGFADVVSGDFDLAIKAYSDILREKYGVGFNTVYGMKPFEQDRYFVGNTTAKVRKSKEVIAMERRMDTAKDKSDAIPVETLRDVIVFGDTSSENLLFKYAGYPCIVNPSEDLQRTFRRNRRMGMLANSRESINTLRKILDFLYCVPYITPVGEYEIRRKIQNNDRRVSIGTDENERDFPWSSVEQRGQSAFRGFAKNTGLDESATKRIWKKLREFADQSKLNDLGEIRVSINTLTRYSDAFPRAFYTAQQPTIRNYESVKKRGRARH